MTRNMRQRRAIRHLVLSCILLSGSAGCGTLLDPLVLISYSTYIPIAALAAATTPREQLTPVGADETHLYAIRMDNPLSFWVPFSYYYSTVAYGVPYDIDAIDLATGQRTRVRSGLASNYFASGPVGTQALCDGRWLVTVGPDAGLHIFDLTTQQDTTLFAGLFNAPAAGLASLADGKVAVVSNEFLLVVDLETGNPNWFTIADLGFVPARAVVSGNQVAAIGDPLFDPLRNPLDEFASRINVYVLDLPSGSPRLLQENIAPFSYGFYSRVRFRSGAVFWEDQGDDGSRVRVLSTDVVSGEIHVVLDLPGAVYKSDGSSLYYSILDFGPSGVMYAQFEGISPDLTQWRDINDALTNTLLVRLATLDGADRELRSISVLAPFFPPIRSCGIGIYGTAYEASFGNRLIGTNVDSATTCSIDVYDGATNSHSVVSVK